MQPMIACSSGAVLVTAALLTFVYCVSQAPEVGWAATQTVILLAAAAVLLALFLVVETRAEAPLLPLPLFRLRGVAGSNAVGFLLGAIGVAVTSSIATAHFQTLARDGYATAAAHDIQPFSPHSTE